MAAHVPSLGARLLAVAALVAGGAGAGAVLAGGHAASAAAPRVTRLSPKPGGTQRAASRVAVRGAGTTFPGTDCPVFPADNVWNTPITNLPVAKQSATWLASMDSGSTDLHPDYGPSGDPSNPYGIPFDVVTSTHQFVHLTFQYSDESDPGPYPFGPDIKIEGGQNASGDRHALMLDKSSCTLYELYDAYYAPNGGSTAGSGAIWKLTSNALRPAGWTSADAAGLPILPGLVDYDEAASGHMDHAIRFTVQCTQQSYIWPARHEAGQADPSCPPMGARFRLNAGFDLPASQCATMCQTVLTTMKTYGLIVADNGSNWYFQGTADTRWTYPDVDELKQIPANQFQAVDESSLMVDPNSGEVATGAIVAAAPTPDGKGYYLVAGDGAVTVSGDAHFHGDPAGTTLNAPIVAIAVDPATGGYWLLGDGGVFSYDAPYFGSTGNEHLNSPAVGLEATPDGRGYRFVAADGGIFDFGPGAHFHGSEGGRHLNDPIVGMADDDASGGYWLVASDGGVFAFDARYLGSTGSQTLNAPIVQMEALAAGDGYRFVAADGGVFDFGAAHYLGSLGGRALDSPVVGMAAAPAGSGYWIVQASGQVSAFGTT